MTTDDASPASGGSRDPATDSIKASYAAWRYPSQPCSTSTPWRIATIARLMGIASPEPSTARVLEIACGDGGNLIPMAAVAPGARFLGIDIASGAIAEARAMASDLRLTNVSFVDGDMRDLPGDAGSFDYIIAHGFYSWVPADVRVALFETLRSRLAPDGIAFISHNVLPGCALRGITWSLLRPHVESIDDPARRIDEAHAMATRMANALAELPGIAPAIGAEFREVAEREAHVLMHDDLAVVNHPVLLREIAAQADAHGLAWLADSDPYRHAAPAYDEAMNAWLAATDRMTREHVIDHLRLRRYRESLFVHRDRGVGSPLAPERLAPMHLAASNRTVERHGSLPRGPAEGDRSPAAVQRRLLDRLVAAHPATVPAADVVTWITRDSAPGSPLTAPAQALRLLLNACTMGVVIVHAWPVPVANGAGLRPRAFAPARWQASRQPVVVNLRHDGVKFDDPVLRRLLPLLDGTRTRSELANALAGIAPGSPNPARLLEDYLAHFAKIGLLEA